MKKRDGVLVVDDDPDFRELVRMVLEPRGLAVFAAANCSVGIAMLEREHERLRAVLLDYFMPGMSPAQCAAEMCQRAGTEVLVALVTAAAYPAQHAAELGLSRWLSKPFDTDQLCRLVGVAEQLPDSVGAGQPHSTKPNLH